jgi:hypothetical protein
LTTRSLNFLRLFASGMFVLALQSTAFAQLIAPGTPTDQQSVPGNLQVPAGHSLFLKAHAVGTQNYVCLPSGWTFLGPQATLYVASPWLSGDNRQQIATHFLSSNPSENGVARATWQASLDTSLVWARAIANSSDPAFVGPNTIPWLLLEVVGSQQGPMGGSTLAGASYLQRVNTTGGAAPTGACIVGSTALVPYAADYNFYKSNR